MGVANTWDGCLLPCDAGLSMLDYRYLLCSLFRSTVFVVKEIDFQIVHLHFSSFVSLCRGHMLGG